MTLDERLAASLAGPAGNVLAQHGLDEFRHLPARSSQACEWQHDWEPQLLEATRGTIFKNTFADIEDILKRLGEGCGTRFEFECYDVGHLYTLTHFYDRGLVKGPLFIQFVLGILGGIGADPDNLSHMKRIADKLFGDDYRFSVLAAGRQQMPLITMAATMGGNVRVGLEDSLYLGAANWPNPMPTRCAASARFSKRLSLDVATPDEARAMLALKGGDRVAF